MKQYLLAGVAVLLVSVHASDNPFDLKENFGKLDQDQEMLLGDFKKIAEEEFVTEQVLKDRGTEKVAAKKVEAVSEVISKASEEDSSISVARLDMMRQKALEASKQQAIGKALKEEAPKQKEDQLKQLEAKKEAERREVEAYEKQRAEKFAKQKATEQAAALEREALAQKEAKEKAQAAAKTAQEANAAKVAQEKVAQKEAESKKASAKQVAVAQTTNEVKAKEVVTNDINVTREKIEAKLAADKAYEEAVKEMSQED